MESMYRDVVRVTLTPIIEAPNVPGIQPGDHFANSVQQGYEIIFDGGLDFRDYRHDLPQSRVREIRERGQGWVLHKDFVYQYVVRKPQVRRANT